MNDRRFLSRAAAAVSILALASVALGDEVHLTTGDLLTGEVTEHTAERVVVTHPVLGELVIPMSDVASVVYGDAASADDAAEAVVAEADETPQVEEVPKEWAFSVNLSANGSWGNTDEQSARVGFTGTRERPDTRLALDASYYGGVTDGETSDNNATAGALHDWLFPDSKWFWFAAGRYDFDQFESWDHRVTGQTGPGYHLIERDDLMVDFRTGVGPRKEWGSDDDSWRFEAVFGPNFEWTISERQKLSGRTAMFFALDDPDNYRVRSSLDWSMQLDPELSLSLVAGVRHEYQDVVDSGDDRNSTKAFVGLQVDF